MPVRDSHDPPLRVEDTPNRRSDTAQRLLREAMRLFAEQGYARTSVADIQAAVGLNAGSGALYKHYPSKEAVLRAGLAQFIAAGEQGQAVLTQLPDEPETALAIIGRQVLAVLGERRDEIRIVWRELEPFPELRDQVCQAMQGLYGTLATWLAAQRERGTLDIADPAATAAVMLGSLTMFRVFETLLGARPAPVDDEQFLNAWLSLLRNGLVGQRPSMPPAAGD